MKNIIRLIVLLISSSLCITQVNAAYKFPWASTVSWEWWTRSPSPTWHTDCTGKTKCAVDLGTSGNYREVLTIDAGTVTSVCTSTNTADVYVNHGGTVVGYFHIDKATLEGNISINSSVAQGQLLGKSRTGSFTETTSCGYQVSASQSSSNSHLHFQVPIPGTYVLDGWTLSYPNTYMTNDSTTKYAGESFTSTNNMIIKGETINTPKTYTTKEIMIIQEQTIIDGSNGTITFKTL